MNGCREDSSCCYLHPEEVFVGVCPLCLHERLLILAARQGNSSARGVHRNQGVTHSRKPSRNFPKIFSLSSLLNRLEVGYWKSDISDQDASTSPEDSFISIKFEDNGVASWEKGTVPKVSLEHCSKWNHDWSKEAKQGKDTTKESMSVIEHKKQRASMRWRKRIGHLLQHIKWKRSKKANVCHVSTKVEGGVKVRKGWIRTLTKRRAKE